MLAHEFPEDFPGSRPALVFGVLRDKDWKSMLAVLGPLATRVLLVPVKSERALQPDEMLSDCQQANPKAPVSVYASLEEALQAVKTEPLVVVTGSLYLVGEAMELLGLAASPTREERSLNEWGADTPSTQKPLRNELRPPK